MIHDPSWLNGGIVAAFIIGLVLGIGTCLYFLVTMEPPEQPATQLPPEVPRETLLTKELPGQPS